MVLYVVSANLTAVCSALPIPMLRVSGSLVTSAIFLRICTYENRLRKLFRICTYKTCIFKPFGICTYNTPRGGTPPLRCFRQSCVLLPRTSRLGIYSVLTTDHCFKWAGVVCANRCSPGTPAPRADSRHEVRLDTLGDSEESSLAMVRITSAGFRPASCSPDRAWRTPRNTRPALR
jgi:hypothetical protein